MKKLSILICLILGISSAGIFTACESITPSEIVGTYYCYYSINSGYVLHKDTYMTLYEDYKCDYNFSFLLAAGLTDKADGKCQYFYNGNSFRLHDEFGFFSSAQATILNDIIILRDYYFCKEGVVPYETINGVKYAPYHTGFSAALGGEQKQVTIKPTYKDLPVKILNNAFCGTEVLESVVVEDGVREIGVNAFSNNDHLDKVTLNGDMKIGIGAFSMNTALEEVNISGLTNIADSMFGFCNALETINIPDSVMRIERMAFYCCFSLTSVNIHKTVNYIGDRAFGDCTSLESIEFDGTMKEWQDIEKADTWAQNCQAVVKCIDGNITL